MSDSPSTPLPVIAATSAIVTQIADRLTGDRADYPLLVAAMAKSALEIFGYQSRIMYGNAAWVEVLEGSMVHWAGCFDEHFHFWLETESGETVDLNASVAHRMKTEEPKKVKSMYSPPILWSSEFPRFYYFNPTGVAEIDLKEARDQELVRDAISEVKKKAEQIKDKLDDIDFPNEPIICPNRKLLDDTKSTFKHFDRALSVKGIPKLEIAH